MLLDWILQKEFKDNYSRLSEEAETEATDSDEKRRAHFQNA